MEKLLGLIANVLPKKLCYFVYVRVHAYATGKNGCPTKHPDEVTWSMALDVWEK